MKKISRRDWKIKARMIKYNLMCIDKKIQMIKNNNLDKPKPQPNICPDCNVELNVPDKCELCGWEWKKCKWWDDKWKKCTWWGKSMELEFCRECKEYKTEKYVQEL